jgi:hypothetical protein
VSAQTIDFEDAEGDALYRAPAFQDLLLGQVTKDADGALQLLMEVAGAVPESPDLPRPGNEIWWTWVFEFDETAEPNGYPWIRAHRPEFMVYVRWDDSDFAGFAIDRRPLLTGGDAVVTALSSFGFTSDRTIIEIELESDLVGDFPDSFGWQLVAFDWSHVGSESCHVIDNFDFNYIPFP